MSLVTPAGAVGHMLACSVHAVRAFVSTHWLSVVTIPVQVVRLNQDRIQYWMSVGAQPTDTVNRLLGQANILPSVARREPCVDQEVATTKETTEENSQ